MLCLVNEVLGLGKTVMILFYCCGVSSTAHLPSSSIAVTEVVLILHTVLVILVHCSFTAPFLESLKSKQCSETVDKIIRDLG